jgi:hypothetical protein
MTSSAQATLSPVRGAGSFPGFGRFTFFWTYEPNLLKSNQQKREP